MTESFNLASGALPNERAKDGWRTRSARVGDALGAAMIGGSVYELPAGERTFPYHFHHGVEEWLIVVEGSPTVRTPDGARTLCAGDVVCFPSGSAGAHDVVGPGRVLILSTGETTSVSVYPESGKLGTRPPDRADSLNFRRAQAVDYWDFEE
jgi:uncharacterized cupin superfamily protein